MNVFHHLFVHVVWLTVDLLISIQIVSHVNCVIYRNTLYYVTCEYVILLFLFQGHLVTCETDFYSSKLFLFELVTN